ncbi:GIY-YIG nuclease family protein [Fulvivirga sediminis]|uniref:GIY-YIG nuclease family protein n=1 Tax=Fulvivirga sediminis TaxID=2803949 RepID=A0A937FDT9_9BACT|nr:GIY-YIG nuclease family protein [Fulvivirga sediminis]MBL3658578.1 GIY-YIG nuclease family protein [Fulvivirga sediminis]
MAKEKKLTEEDDALLAELGIEVEAKKVVKHTPPEERIIAGFEEIQQFVEENKRLPQHGEDKDIFERLYAVRLDQIRKKEECRILVKDIDHQNLLDDSTLVEEEVLDDLDDDELLAQLGVDGQEENSITNLRHVKTRAEKRAAEEIANREVCEDFEQFKPLFEAVKKDIDNGLRTTIRFRKDAGFTKTDLKETQWIIVGGQMAYIAEIGDTFKAPNGEEDSRLRVIYANGTESNILLRSLIRAMYKDETSRFITPADSGPLFNGESSADDQESGTIYVLRSKSDHPTIKESREIVHKIGVTGGAVEKRIINAKNDPTFLMADVEIVATYKLANINRVKLEAVIHRFFSPARLDIEIMDRFGKPVKAREWFLVPIFVIDEMVEKIKEGSLSHYYYDPKKAELGKHKSKKGS